MALEDDFHKPIEQIMDESQGHIKSNAQNNILNNQPLDLSLGNEPLQPFFQPFNKPEIALTDKESPGFFSTLEHSFLENNEVAEGARAISSTLEHVNHLQDEIPDGWTSFNTESLDGIDNKYWSYVLDAVSPKEQQARRESILNKQTQDESYKNGSFMAKLIGGGAGYLMGPSSLMFPLSATVKYARLGEKIVMNTMRQAPALAQQSITHNALMQGMKVGGNMEDFVVDSIVDTTAGLALTGIGAGIGASMTGASLFNARKALNLNREGIEVGFNVDKDGIMNPSKPFIANPIPGNSISAAEVSTAQDFLDSKFAKTGLFQLMPQLTTAFGHISPTIRMLNSSFNTTSEFINRLTSHSFITKGLESGKAMKDKFETKLWEIRNNSQMIGWQLEGFRAEANGIESGGVPENLMESFKTRLKKGETFDKNQFGGAVYNVIRTGEQHDNKAINAAAAYIKPELEKIYTRYLESHGLDSSILSPRTAYEYIMRNYDQQGMLLHEENWIRDIPLLLEEQDNLITELMAPIKEKEALIKSLEDNVINGQLINDTDIKEASDLLAAHKSELQRLNNELSEELELNPDHHILLESRLYLSYELRMELENLHNPITTKKEEIAKIAPELKALKAQRARSKQAVLKAKTSVTKDAHLNNLENANIRIDELEARINSLKDELLSAEADLRERALKGEINRRLYHQDPETGKIKFRDFNEKPRLRAVYPDEFARIEAAKNAYEKITNTTPEQLNKQVLGTLTGNLSENPNKERSLLIPDHYLQSMGVLSNDLSKNIALYNSVLGKKAAFKEVFSNFGTGDGVEGIVNELKKEFTQKKLEIRAGNPDEIDKKLIKLNKQFKKDISDINKAYQFAMGNTNYSNRAMNFAKGSRALTALVRLGGLPLTMITDIAGVLFNHSVVDVIRDGFIPFAKTMNGHLKGKESESYRENAAHLGIASEHLLSSYADRFWNGSTQSDVTAGGAIANSISTLAHVSSNLSGANYLDNFVQRLTANVVQSKVMNYLFKFKEGKLSNKELHVLNQLGISPKEWADRFIDSFKKSDGHSNGSGGYNSQYFNWADIEASNKMAYAIRGGVRASVLKKGLADSPWFTNDPLLGMLTQLKAWSFTAFSRYTVPAMQRMDSEKALGLGMMLLLGSLVDPLRKWSRGESYDFSDKTKFAIDTITNSGATGIIMDALQEANALLDGDLLPKMKSDKYRNRTVAGILGGPLGGMADDIAHVTSSFLTGKINQNDFNKFVRLIPFSQLWYMRYLSNKLTESMDLPKTKDQANGWFQN